MTVHVCRPFVMKSDSYLVEVDGDCWVLHVFDVQGGDDILAVQLRLGSVAEYHGFQDSFKEALLRRSPAHTAAASCPECRSEDQDLWITMFSEWVKDAYSAMPNPPLPVDAKDIPEVVRLSMECIYGQERARETSSLN